MFRLKYLLFISLLDAYMKKITLVISELGAEMQVQVPGKTF